MTSSHALPAALLAALALQWIALAIEPVDRATWALENMLLVLFVAALVATYRRFRFSDAAYVAMFVFLSLHVIGGHFTYSLVPYDAWAARLTGTTINEMFGWRRNHYDRLLHFLFGVQYLGTQGDEWDSQRDMALAALGAVLAMSLAAGLQLMNRSREST